MRYIGNKQNLVDTIGSILDAHGVAGETFCDLFSGTTSVARFFKHKGYRIISNDILYLSYCLQRAYIENNSYPKFESLLPHLDADSRDRLFATELGCVIDYLNRIPSIEGFIYSNYTPDGTCSASVPRMYFTSENGRRIDAIRERIESWNDNGWLTQSEYYILIACLIESISFYANVSGVYAAFQKKWDPRAIKPLLLRPIEIINNGLCNESYCQDGVALAENIDVDILYLDPPYNERQFAPNYHLLETIARYDNPTIRGISGMRDYTSQKSRFCNHKTAIIDLEKIAATAKYKYLVLSYNSEGIMSGDKILEILGKYGQTQVEEFTYSRFKSNSRGTSAAKKTVKEQLYILSYGK